MLVHELTLVDKHYAAPDDAGLPQRLLIEDVETPEGLLDVTGMLAIRVSRLSED
jgi:hypothetical protein